MLLSSRPTLPDRLRPPSQLLWTDGITSVWTLVVLTPSPLHVRLVHMQNARPQDRMLAELFDTQKRLKMSSVSLAALLSVAPMTVYRWRKGKNMPRYAVLVRSIEDFIAKHRQEPPRARKGRP